VDRLSLRAVIGTTDGGLLRASVTGNMDDAEKLGAALAAELLDMGGFSALGEQLDREI
jgi:hydroxymethylbilane synthase